MKMSFITLIFGVLICSASPWNLLKQEHKIAVKNENQISSSEDLERSGCCSHHGGVCGCAGMRAQCCDGSLSPTCGC